jgi:hypothetical protein
MAPAVLAGVFIWFTVSSFKLRENAFRLSFRPQITSEHHDCAAPSTTTVLKNSETS